MGGGDRVVRSQDFRGGEITAIMGGFGIDLRGAAIAGDSATIHIFTLWGGVDLKVPEEWNVVHYAQGGYLVIAPVKIGAGATIGLRAVIMGGVEVKN